MAKRLALITLAVTSPLLLACLFVNAAAASWLAALLSVTQPVALMALGASRNGSLGPLRRVMAATLLWFLSLMLSLLLLDGWRVAWKGVPITAILMLGGLWIIPMVFLTVAYAKTFSNFSLTDEDLRRIRRSRTHAPAASRANRPPGEPASL